MGLQAAPEKAKTHCLCISIVQNATKRFEPDEIDIKPLSQVEDFLYGAVEPADHLKHAMQTVRTELAAPSGGIMVCLAAIRFKIGLETLYILEMPESGDTQRDVGAHNPTWERELRAALCS